ncbi:MAG: leucine-rich repeat domain-containing protein [Bacteroidaceae bacterium]|nr:leucine-rich repeat domain-containing protein [Bacteroidaceae bacterium]
MAEKVFVIPEGTEVISRDYLHLLYKGETYEEVVIPKSVNRIEAGAFEGDKSPLKIIISRGIKDIPYSAFCRCKNLKEVWLPDTIESIGDYAFMNCSSLRFVNMPGVKSLGKYSFYQCYSLESVALPDTLREIGDNAFSACTSLHSINIPKRVERIDGGAFSGPNNLPIIDGIQYADTFLVRAVNKESSVYNIKKGTRFIADDAFKDCRKMISMELPESVESIGDNAFSACTSLHSINIPKRVERIDGGAFSGPNNLPIIDGIQYADTFLVRAVNKESSVYNIKKGTRFIADDAFKDCRKMISMELPESVESIGISAFWECSSLNSVKFPKKLQHIEAWAFYRCVSLKTIDIPKRINTISAGAFANCSSLTSLQIPKNVTQLERGAFSECTKLEEIVIPSSVKVIGDDSFKDCRSLRTVIINNKEATIGKDAFRNCDSLQTVQFPNGIKSLEDQAFWYCRRLRDIDIQGRFHVIRSRMHPAELKVMISEMDSQLSFWYLNVLSAGKSGFSHETNQIEVHKGIEIIGNNTFENYSKLEDVTLPEGVFTILEKGFKDCTSLKHIHLPSSLKSIGRLSFHNCKQLKGIELSQGVTFIDSAAFSGCTSLSSISIPEGISEINSFTFSGCHSLTTVYLPSTVTVIYPDAFRSCHKLKEVHLDRTQPMSLRVFRTAFMDIPSDCTLCVHEGEICNRISVNALNHTQRYMDIPYTDLLSYEMENGESSSGGHTNESIRPLGSVKPPVTNTIQSSNVSQRQNNDEEVNSSLKAKDKVIYIVVQLFLAAIIWFLILKCKG